MADLDAFTASFYADAVGEYFDMGNQFVQDGEWGYAAQMYEDAAEAAGFAAVHEANSIELNATAKIARWLGL